ncbi:glycoside hydrolase family 3 protein [Rhizoctonia solani AG-1 IA]|uniref:beta-glucosidase n=1 Tax=Thanatephorus cucumeris (strain AG1-IA) TaxID=983506 RepID=L8X526_THACA|nr:glycoside hydrolase family 3 protein [Rhizoctonia solani AG-1 IA]
MPPHRSRFEPLDVENILASLTLTEKARLLAGVGWVDKTFDCSGKNITIFLVAYIRSETPWGTCSEGLTDGPNGARGLTSPKSVFEGVPAACFPGATGLAASWDLEYLRTVGRIIALDCKDKGAHVLLGPTVNIQRSPLGGRGFESYSEDPVLSGYMARAFIEGLQSEGVAATIKHFVANDSEFERIALREIYLRPFELACRETESPAWAVMTAYNRVNAPCNSFCRFGTSSADLSIKAGLDLEMPGPAVWRGDALQRCVAVQKVGISEIDERVRQLLGLINKVSASGIPEDAEENGNPTEEVVGELREAARNANVLLKNDTNLLPLNLSKIKSIAIIGPNADAPVFSGGGSANLRPYQHTTALEGIRNALESTDSQVKVHHVIGALSHKLAPLLGTKQLRTKEGKPGFDIEWFHEDPVKNINAERVHYTHGTHSSMWFIDNLPEHLNPRCWATITATYTPEFSGKHEFGVSADGLVDMYLDGTKIIDNSTSPTPGSAFFGTGTTEVLATVNLEANKSVQIVLQYASALLAREKGIPESEFASLLNSRGGCRFGGGPIFTVDEGIQDAIEAAKGADAAIIINHELTDWESEGHDRTNMSLPGATNQLVSAVLKANKQTIIVVISGTPVTMPWASEASAVIQSFYGGGESGNGLADVLLGKVNPSSKLPLSFPKVGLISFDLLEHELTEYQRDEDVPSYLKFPGENGKIVYAQLHFRYTRFDYQTITLSGSIGNDSTVDAEVTLQIYVQDVVSRLDRPTKELKGFAKTALIKPGEIATVKIVLDRYAFAYFDEWAGPDAKDGEGRWVAEKGEFRIIAAASSEDERIWTKISLKESFEWL